MHVRPGGGPYTGSDGIDRNLGYQLVRMRFPSWDVQGRLLIRNNHINVFVEGPSCRDRGYADYEASGCTQDFNLIDPDPEAPTTVISDEHATSLYLIVFSNFLTC